MSAALNRAFGGRTPSERRLCGAFAGILAYGALQLWILMARPGGQDVTAQFDQGLQALAVCIGITLCFWNGQSFRMLRLGSRRHGDWWTLVPLFIVTSLLAILAGTLLDLYFVVVLGHGTPMPYWDDVFYLAAYLLFVPTVWSITWSFPTVDRLARSLLDSLIVLSAVFACAWVPLLGPTLQRAPEGSWAKIVYSCYPVLSCLAVASIVLAWMHCREPHRRPALILFSLAGALLALSVTSNVYETLLDTYRIGDLSDAGWPVGVMLCGLTAAATRCEYQVGRCPLRGAGARLYGAAPARPVIWRQLLPYGLLPVVALAAIASWRSGDRQIAAGTAACDWLLAGLVVVRQVLSVAENSRLVSALMARQERLTALQTISSTLAATRTPNEIGEQVMRIGALYLHAPQCTMRLVSADGAWLEQIAKIATTGDDDDDARFPNRRPCTDQVPSAEAVRTGGPIWLESPTAMHAGFPTFTVHLLARGHRSYAVLPLLIAGRSIGTLGLLFPEPRRFADDEREFLMAVAGLIAQALDRARLYVQEQTRAQAAESLARMRGDFVASVSHELRTPLTAIVGYAELLQARWSSMSEDARLGHVQRIVRSANRQIRLVQDILLVSRLDTGALSVDCTSIELDSQMAVAITELQGSYRGQVVMTHGQAGVCIRADGARVTQILVNVLDNAAKYSPDGSPIDVLWETTATEVLVRVRDYGPGIPLEGRQRLFSRFGRIAESRIRAGRVGTGLGLFLGRQLARAMAGDLELEVTGPQGSTFCLRLPRALEVPEMPGSP